MTFTENPYQRGRVLDEYRARRWRKEHGAPEDRTPPLPDGWAFDVTWEPDDFGYTGYDGDGMGAIHDGIGYGPDVVQLCDNACAGEHSRYLRPHERHRYWEPDKHFPSFDQFRDYAARGASKQVAFEAYERHKRECAEWLDTYVAGDVGVHVVDERGVRIGSAHLGGVEEDYTDDAASEHNLYDDALDDARRTITHNIATWCERSTRLAYPA